MKKQKQIKRNVEVFKKDQLESLDDVLTVVGAHFVIARCTICGLDKKILDEIGCEIVGVNMSELSRYAVNFINNPTITH